MKLRRPREESLTPAVDEKRPLVGPIETPSGRRTVSASDKRWGARRSTGLGFFFCSAVLEPQANCRTISGLSRQLYRCLAKMVPLVLFSSPPFGVTDTGDETVHARPVGTCDTSVWPRRRYTSPPGGVHPTSRNICISHMIGRPPGRLDC